jgi:hypothetical protein
MNIFARIRHWLCDHEWRPTRFQALVPGASYECVKCGKIERFYQSPNRETRKPEDR